MISVNKALLRSFLWFMLIIYRVIPGRTKPQQSGCIYDVGSGFNDE